LTLLLNAPNGKSEAFPAPISTIKSSTQTVSPMATETTSAVFISAISGRNLADLEAIRKEFGRMVHTKLTEEVKAATANGGVSPSLILINTASAGKDTNAIAANDGSSKYLMGGITNYAATAPPLGYHGMQPKEHVDKLFAFYDQQGIASTIIAGGDGYASGENAGKFVVYAASREDVLSAAISANVAELPGTPEHRKAMQEISAIATLGLILQLQGIDSSAIVSKIEEMEGEQIDVKDALMSNALEVEKFNEGIWDQMAPLLQKMVAENPNQKISVGESFTSGILASLMTSLEGASKVVDVSLNWYSPKLKQYVGVPAENVTEKLIAEPETIRIAALGLLDKAPATTGIALGTTGWANYWIKDKLDYFSIGIASRNRTEGQEPEAAAIKVTVTRSENHATSKGRRQLTRHLGATAALFLLATALAKSYPQENQFGQIANATQQLIEQNGTIEFLDR